MVSRMKAVKTPVKIPWDVALADSFWFSWEGNVLPTTRGTGSNRESVVSILRLVMQVSTSLGGGGTNRAPAQSDSSHPLTICHLASMAEWGSRAMLWAAIAALLTECGWGHTSHPWGHRAPQLLSLRGLAFCVRGNPLTFALSQTLKRGGLLVLCAIGGRGEPAPLYGCCVFQSFRQLISSLRSFGFELKLTQILILIFFALLFFFPLFVVFLFLGD